MFLWSAVCMISEWKNFSKNKWITLAPTPSDVSWADTAARLWSLAHRNRGDRRWGEGLAVAPSTLAPHFGAGWGAGQPCLGSACQGFSCWRRTKIWPFANGAGNSIVTWFLGRTRSFPPQRPFLGLFSLQPSSMRVFLQGLWLGWGDWFGQWMHRCRVGYACLTVCAELHPNPPLPPERLPWRLRARTCPPWVTKPSSLCSVQPWTGACRWYCSARNKYW